MVAAIFFGREAFTYRKYSWIAILVNIPATMLMIAYYELVMRDSVSKIKAGHMQHEEGEDALVRHLTNIEEPEGNEAAPDGVGTSLRKRFAKGSLNGKSDV